MKENKGKIVKRWALSKRKTTQDFYPFRYIYDNYVEMDNGDINIYLKIKASNVDLLSTDEVKCMMEQFSFDLDRIKYAVSFIIQDTAFSLDQPIKIYREKARKTDSTFVRTLAEAYIEELDNTKNEVSKKQSYLRVYIPANERKNYETVDTIVGKIKDTMQSSLELLDCDSNSIKQMYAIFANRMFTDNLPDTEIEFDDNTKEQLLKKRKIPYEFSSNQGIYNFKDMIVPATLVSRPNSLIVGKNICRVYGVRSFLATTTNTSLLSRISAIKGVTVQIYLEKMKVKKFKTLLKKDVRSKKADVIDELDQIEMEEQVRTSITAFSDTNRNQRDVYYVTVYFMITARNKGELEQIEDEFYNAIDAVGITLDSLETLQEDAYRAISPLGSNTLDKRLKQNIPSLSVGNLYPFNEPALLDKNGLPLAKVSNTTKPIMFNQHSVERTNQNILILGNSGSGKTVAMMKLLENALMSGCSIRNIDVEGTYVSFTNRLGGINLNVSGNNEYCINRLQIRLPDEVKEGIVDDYISEVKGWMRIYKPNWSDRHLDLFERYLSKTYELKGFKNNNVDFTSIKPTDYPILGDVYNLIKEELNSNKLEENLIDTAEDILLGMESAVYGADAKIFNRHTFLGDTQQSDFINFDMHEMMSSDVNKKLAQWDNIFSFNAQFVNRNMERSKKIVLAIDELHELLKKEFKPLVYSITSYERRFRKYKACFIKATQTIDEVVSDDTEMSSLVNPLFALSATKLLFSMGDADYDKLKRMLSLKDTELEIIRKPSRPVGSCVMRVGGASYDVRIDMPEWYKTVKKDA